MKENRTPISDRSKLKKVEYSEVETSLFRTWKGRQLEQQSKLSFIKWLEVIPSKPVIRFTLSYLKLYLHIIQFYSVIFPSTENRRIRSFSSIDNRELFVMCASLYFTIFPPRMKVCINLFSQIVWRCASIYLVRSLSYYLTMNMKRCPNC